MSRIFDAHRRGGHTPNPDRPVPPAAGSTTSGDSTDALNSYPVENAGPTRSPRLDPPRWASPQPPPNIVIDVVHRGSLVPLDSGHKLVVHPDSPIQWVESYLELAEALDPQQPRRPLKTLLVMSARRGEGRTITATNLALTFSERLGKRVLLIDADVHKPATGEIFKLPAEFKWGDLLSSPIPKVHVAEVSPTLSVLPAAASRTDPMTALVSPGMRLLLDQVQQYDHVILDTPPLQSMRESHLLAWMADSIVLVIGAGRTPRRSVTAAVQDLGADRIVGTVLNWTGNG